MPETILAAVAFLTAAALVKASRRGLCEESRLTIECAVSEFRDRHGRNPTKVELTRLYPQVRRVR